MRVPSQPGENLGKVCENSQAGENPASWIFTDLLSNSPKRSSRFLPGHEGTPKTEEMFSFLTNEQEVILNQIFLTPLDLGSILVILYLGISYIL